jgi:hypothetical protein
MGFRMSSGYKFGRGASTAGTRLEKFGLFMRVSIFTLFLLLPLVVYIIYSIRPPDSVSGRTIDKGKYDPYITFTTDWFQFTVPRVWEEVPSANVPGKVYVYKQSVGKEPIGQLRIYVNSDVIEYQNYYTRVQPVNITNSNSLHPLELQPHCNTALKEGQNKGIPTLVTQSEVNFMCWVDGTNIYAVAGAVGGGSTIELVRNNGEKAKYIITDRNTAYTPNENSFTEVLKNFVSR